LQLEKTNRSSGQAKEKVLFYGRQKIDKYDTSALHPKKFIIDRLKLLWEKQEYIKGELEGFENILVEKSDCVNTFFSI
jgi:hypothetical protein